MELNVLTDEMNWLLLMYQLKLFIESFHCVIVPSSKFDLSEG